jgi:Protein of unknown function, DUF481
MKSTRAFPLVGLLLFALSGSALAQKTDVIVLFNGDHVTGEIKSYATGRLTVETDIGSDLSLKWNRITSITSDKEYEVESTDGAYHYGSLAPSTPAGKLVVTTLGNSAELEFLDVVRISPIRQTFWHRWDGSLDLGFNYTQASSIVQFNLNANAVFRRPTFAATASLNTFFSSQNGVASSQRANFALGYEKLMKDHWFLAGFGGVDRNLDLGLDLRLSIGAGYGRYLIQTNRTTFSALLGISGDHEDPVTGQATYEAAALIGLQYSTFTYDFPKITVNSTLQVLPYLTDSGRVRIEFNVQAKREIVRDFYLSLSIFDSYDSRDPSTQQAKNDWGPVLSIGWTF